MLVVVKLLHFEVLLTRQKGPHLAFEMVGMVGMVFEVVATAVIVSELVATYNVCFPSDPR